MCRQTGGVPSPRPNDSFEVGGLVLCVFRTDSDFNLVLLPCVGTGTVVGQPVRLRDLLFVLEDNRTKGRLGLC